MNIPFDRIHWTSENRSVGRLFLDHTLMVSEVMVAIELTCRRSPHCRLIHQSDAEFPFRDRPSPFSWNVTVSGRKSVRIIPDHVFAIESINRGRTETIYYFLEADRGTMPVVRRNWNQTSFQRKLEAYAATWEQRLHQSELQIDRIRVLTVTTSPARVESIMEAGAALRTGRGLFLFTDIDRFRNADDQVKFLWNRIDGGTESLLPH